MGRQKKFERFKVKQHKYTSGKVKWQVSGTTREGKRIRQYYPNQAEAIDRKNELDKEYNNQPVEKVLRRTSLSEDQLADAETASLQTEGKKLTTIISNFHQLKERVAKCGITLDAAVSFCEKHYRSEITERSLYTAISEFMETRKSLRPKTIADYKTSTNLLLKLEPNTPVHSVSLSDIEKILNKFKKPNTKKTYRKGLNTFFQWCKNHEYALENPCDRLDPIPGDRSRIKLLTFEEVQKLLKASMLYKDGIMLPYITIGLFAGLRPSEIEDLKKSNFKKDQILVEGGKLRRKLKRKVPIPENLKEWLNFKPFTETPPGLRNKFRVVKTAAKPGKWTQDMIRHTSISYQADRDENEEMTAFRNGTSKAMIDLHYREIIEDSEEVTKFWSLTPKSIQEASIEINLPEPRKKIEWPSDAQLKQLVLKKPLSHLAEEIGVSDKAIRNRCLARGIELPGKGYWQKLQSNKISRL